MAANKTLLILIIATAAVLAEACPPGMIPCEDTSCAPPGGTCPESYCEDGSGRVIDCKAFKVVHHESMLISAASGQRGSRQQPKQRLLQQQQQQQQQRQHTPNHLSKLSLEVHKLASANSRSASHPDSSLLSRASQSLLPSTLRRASKQAARKLQQIGGALDAMMLGGMGDILGMNSAYSNTEFGSLGGLLGLLGGATGTTGLTGNSPTGWNGMSSMLGYSGLTNTAAAAYTSQPYPAFQPAGNLRAAPASFESGFSSDPGFSAYASQQNLGGSSMDPNLLYNTVNGMGNTAWGTKTNVGVLAGGKLDAVGNAITAKSSSFNGGMTALDDARLAQQYGQTGEQLAYAVAPHINNVHNTARGVINTVAPMAQQAVDDAAGLAIQTSKAVPSAVHSIADGTVGVINTVTPYLQGQNNMLAMTANAVQQGAAATQRVKHGTAVPMAQGGLQAMSNVGGHFKTGFAEGFREGYSAVMDRRAPYQDGPSAQQRFAQQPALYLPQSYAPLGAMANITYPCPSGPQNSRAPVGTIIGPGIPCGVPLLVVPKAAVPTNRMAPAVVNPVPVEAPAPPPPSPSPIPIPVTPLPPPAGGGGTTPLPPVVPPIVAPPGGSTPGGTPPVVPPIVNPTSPSPGGGTPIPTTPPTATPGTGTTPTGDGTPIPTTPPSGLTPPIVNPVGASPAPGLRSAANYMEYTGSRMRGSNSVIAQQQALERQRWEGQSASGGHTEGLTASLLNQMTQGLRRLLL